MDKWRVDTLTQMRLNMIARGEKAAGKDRKEAKKLVPPGIYVVLHAQPAYLVSHGFINSPHA